MEYGNYFRLLLLVELLPLWWIRIVFLSSLHFSVALSDKIAAVAGRRWGHPREGATLLVLSNSFSIKSWRFWRLLRIEDDGIIGGSSFCAVSSSLNWWTAKGGDFELVAYSDMLWCGAVASFVAWGVLLFEEVKWPTTAMVMMLMLLFCLSFGFGSGCWGGGAGRLVAGFLCTRNDLITAPLMYVHHS